MLVLLTEVLTLLFSLKLDNEKKKRLLCPSNGIHRNGYCICQPIL